MKKYATLLIILSLASCHARKSVNNHSKNYSKTTSTNNYNSRSLYSDFRGKNSSKTAHLISEAENYMGVPYRYGGTTDNGFDCSGYTTKVFSEIDINLPRRSMDQANEGYKVSISEIKPGDLLFFNTTGGGVSHVGIVHDISNDGEIRFIHASTSKGVTVSSLNEKYWNKNFLFARRVIK